MNNDDREGRHNKIKLMQYKYFGRCYTNSKKDWHHLQGLSEQRKLNNRVPLDRFRLGTLKNPKNKKGVFICSRWRYRC